MLKKEVLINGMTLSRFVLSILFCFAIEADKANLPVIAGLFLFICATDFFDGKLARKYKACTKSGAILDVLADLFFIVSSCTVLIMHGMLPLWILSVVIYKFLEFCFTSHFAAPLKADRASVFLFDGIGRSAAALFYALPIVVEIVDSCLPESVSGLALNGYLLLMVLLTCISTIYRLRIYILKDNNKITASVLSK